MDDLKRLIYNTDMEFYKKSIEIAKSLKGLESKGLLEIFRNMSLQENVVNVIQELKKKGMKTAIATDSYQFVADDLKERLGMDYAFANSLIIDEGIVNGKLIIHNKDLEEDFAIDGIYSICKSCVLEKLCEELNITTDEVIAVGDGRVDICMLKKAGLGVAFNASEEVQRHADVCIDDIGALLKYI